MSRSSHAWTTLCPGAVIASRITSGAMGRCGTGGRMRWWTDPYFLTTNRLNVHFECENRVHP